MTSNLIWDESGFRQLANDDEWGHEFYRRLRRLADNPPEGYTVLRSALYRDGASGETRESETTNYTDHECMFASEWLARRQPAEILDIGSYVHFVIGLLAAYRVTQADIRPRRRAAHPAETIVTCDAKHLAFQSDSFDAVVSLCSVEHFGMGRYGDEFDLDADIKAFAEMRRVVKVGGTLIFTTPINRTGPYFFYNAHRIYTSAVIARFCDGLRLIEERFYSLKLDRFCEINEVTDLLGDFDIYCGCWEKPCQ